MAPKTALKTGVLDALHTSAGLEPVRMLPYALEIPCMMGTTKPADGLWTEQRRLQDDLQPPVLYDSYRHSSNFSALPTSPCLPVLSRRSLSFRHSSKSPPKQTLGIYQESSFSMIYSSRTASN